MQLIAGPKFFIKTLTVYSRGSQTAIRKEYLRGLQQFKIFGVMDKL